MSDRGQELIDKLVTQKNLKFEGRRGIRALCILAKTLGYRDTTYFGQIDIDVTIGDFIEFLQDNPGAVEAVFNWVAQAGSSDFEENLAFEVEEEEDNED